MSTCLWYSVCSRYKRKGNSSLGLDPRKQEVSWEESQSKKKKKGTNKKAADRYYSAVNRQMLKSEALVSIFPTNSECSGAAGPALFLPLADDEENTKGPPGRRFSQNIHKPELRIFLQCGLFLNQHAFLIQASMCSQQPWILWGCTTPLLPSGSRGRDSRCMQNRRIRTWSQSQVQHLWLGELKSLTGSWESSQLTHSYG